MNRFNKKRTNRSTFVSLFLPLVIFIVTVVIFWQSMTHMHSRSVSQQYETLQNALRRSIVHCYATEGFYPPSLAFIKEQYHLSYNMDLFFVDYQPIAQNIMPEITIIQRRSTTR